VCRLGLIEPALAERPSIGLPAPPQAPWQHIGASICSVPQGWSCYAADEPTSRVTQLAHPGAITTLSRGQPWRACQSATLAFQ
jgi:hypothetical protein